MCILRPGKKKGQCLEPLHYPKEGIGKPFAPLRRGPVGLLLELWGIMLNVVPVNQVFIIGQFISQKNQTGSGREMHTVAVACVGIEDTEPRGTQQLLSFLINCTVSNSLLLSCLRNCDTYTCHWQDLGGVGGRWATF
jgi:hypothetical protein